MDHLELSNKNKRNAITAKALGNQKMAKAYTNLAKYHENEFSRKYHEDACLDYLSENGSTVVDEVGLTFIELNPTSIQIEEKLKGVA